VDLGLFGSLSGQMLDRARQGDINWNVNEEARGTRYLKRITQGHLIAVPGR
jgi:hypothetical protein